jgi:hypothetical protein
MEAEQPQRAGVGVAKRAGINACTTLVLKRQWPALAFSANSNNPLAAISREGRAPFRFQ